MTSFAVLCTATPLFAQGPDWLSKPLAPSAYLLTTAQSTKTLHNSGLATEAITTTLLESEQTDAVGILNAEQSGIPGDFWGDSDPHTIARIVAPFFVTALPEITALWQRITLTEINAPVQRDAKGEILLARVDHLLNAGALDQAEALLNRAGRISPELFRRKFDVGLLTQRADSACAEMMVNSSLTPGMKARVFCLAREGDWAAAAITLTTARALGQIEEQDAELLSRFLDPELFEGERDPPAPNPMTALDFTMREALGMARTGQALPLAFLHGDLTRQDGWRNQVMATERLVRAQAIPPAELIALYQDGKPAASGGVWVRVAAVQNLIEAIQNGDSAAVSRALVTAYSELGKVGLTFALADIAADDLRDIPLDDAGASAQFRLWLLHADYRALASGFEPKTAQDEFLMAIVFGQLRDAVPQSDIEIAIVAAFTESKLSNGILWDARRGRLGEAVLKSLTTLIKTRHSDPVTIETALSALLISGLNDEARRIAMQIILNQSGRF